ncbi:hypothetical protein ACTMUQ_42425 [Streptomyces sp. SD11]|uniref:hypothetical protein n=1 Tax=Streptomyces sp. SD11 TaxID=3452209 RepID=UPI003F8A0A0F
MMRRTTAAALVAAGILTAAGCSSSSDGEGSTGSKSSSGQQAPQDDALLKVAKRYQEAANSTDWRTACGLSSSRLRHGTVEECTDRNTPEAPAAEESSSSSPFEPPTYADGSTPDPIKSSTPTGPERADTGPVTISDVVEVPAVDTHPAGYGVLATYTVQWPGKDAFTTRHALRLVRQGGAWVVDQHEEVQDGDMGRGSPVRAALSGG